MSLISSRRNPIVSRLRSLSTKEGRNQQSLLLLEGTHLLEEALKTKAMPVEIIATGKWLDQHKESLLPSLSQVSVQEVSSSVLEAALTTVTPDGVASLFPLNELPRQKTEVNFVLALDRIQDPGNLGTLFRTALAAEIEEIWLASGVDPLNQKVLRASVGTVLHLPFQCLGTSEITAIDALNVQLKSYANRGYQVVATYPHGSEELSSVVPYWEVDWEMPTILVLGNEGSGLHPLIRSSCTHSVTLPHSHSVESLNVAVAAVPLLLERRRAKMTSIRN